MVLNFDRLQQVAKTLSMLTFSYMSLSIMTLSIMTLSITKLSIMTLSITKLSVMTLSITTQHNNVQHSNNNKRMRPSAQLYSA
jgi:hypothetical protein